MRTFNDDPWGAAYMIATEEFGRRLPVLTKKQLLNCVELFFPVGEIPYGEKLVASDMALLSVG